MSLSSAAISTIGTLVTALLNLLSADMVKTAIDGMLDKLEASIKASSNTVDDAIVLPIIAKLRAIISVE